MKKFWCLLLLFVMIFSTFCISNAVEINGEMFPTIIDEEHGIMTISENDPLVSPNTNNSIKVKLDDKYIDFADVEPQIINERTMVPFRKIFNELGVTDENINYTSSEEPITAKKDNIEIILTIGSTTAQKIVDGVTTNITLDSAPVVIDGRTLVPVRFIAESMDKKVGWDADNRTVAVIDTQKLQSELESKIPAYFDLVNTQTEPIKTFDISAKVKGSLKYSQKSQKSNNSNLDIDETLKMQKSNDAIFIDINFKATGKGVLYETFDENGLKELNISAIITKEKIYIKSPLFNETANGKWIATTDESIREFFNIFDTIYSNVGSMEIFNIDEDLITENTYEQLKSSSDLLANLFNENKLKISGTKTKKYEISIDLNDLKEIATKIGADTTNFDTLKSLKIKSSGSIKDGIADSGNAEISLEMVEDDESSAVDLIIDSKVNSVNKSYNISIPSSSEVIEQ